MPVEGTPWFIGAKGVQHPAEVARAVAYASTGGTSGAIGPRDFKVTATGTPSGQVMLYPGAVNIVSNYSGATAQSYVGVLRQADTVSIDPTTSSGGRSDLIVARIVDPQYGNAVGFDPSNPNDFKFFSIAVIKGVSSSTKKWESATDPAIALARIDIPASTSTITNAMITDLRQMANRRTDIQLATYYPSRDFNVTWSSYANWGGSIFWFDVPKWATKAQFTAHLSSIEYVHSGSTPTILGVMGAFGTLNDNQNSVLVAGANARLSHTHVSSFKLDSAFQDLSVGYNLKAARTKGTGLFQLDYQAAMQVQAYFQEDVI